MSSAHFNVFISGTTSSAEDWKKAMSAPESELPELSEQQKEVARKMGIDEKEYARGVLVGKYGEVRERERGEKLGKYIEEILHGLASSYYQLEALVREGTKGRWIARILTPKQVANVAIPSELADDVVDSAASQDIERLKRLVLENIGRSDLLKTQ